MTFSGRARLAGLIGWPVSHSLSPHLHNGWLEKLSIDGVYVPMAVRPDNLKSAVDGLRALGFAGVNVTIPHKEHVIGELDGIDEAAEAIGAVNTVLADDGRLLGSNTDAGGFVRHLFEVVPDWRVRLGERPALILGAGGAARAALFGLSGAGVERFIVLNRSVERARDLVSSVKAKGELVPGSLESAPDAIGRAGLIINTTSAGMVGKEALAIDLGPAPEEAIVYDIVYNPLETELLKSAARRGLMTVDGLGMLIHQAAIAFEAWFGIRPPTDGSVRDRLVSALKT